MKKIYLLILLLLIVGCKKDNNNAEYDFDLSEWNGWVYEGDSITDVSAISYDYPNQLVMLNKSISNAMQANVAKSSDLIHYMCDEYITQVHPLKPTNSNLKYIFAIMAGTNDAANGRSAEQIYNDLKTEWALARADNFKVMSFCITRSTIQIRDTTAAAVNKLIIADPSQYDYLIRTDLILPDPANTNQFTDGLHPTAEGSILIAKEILNVLRSHK